MATNLISLVIQYLTPDMIGRIASAVGLNRGTTQTAVNASVPALLAALGNAAMQPGGAQKLVDAAKQHVGTLDNLVGMIGNGSQSTLADKGSQMLSSLLGGQNQTALGGAIAKFAGVGQGASNSLLGILAPIVMGTIAKQQGGGGLNANNIVSLFAAQKDNIAAALPSGLRDQLRGTGLLDALHGAAGTTATMADQATRAATSATQAVTNTGTRAANAAASGSSNWRYWAIGAAAVIALLVYLNRPVEQVAPQAPQMMGSSQNVMIGGLDVGRQVNDSLASLRTSLQGVSDTASAETAQSKLQQVTAQLDKVTSLTGQLSPDQRRIIAGIVSPAMPALNQQFDKALAVPGVAEVLKPSIDTLKAMLASLTSAA
ncbi:MAG: DUF937 domain-containing protein [Xanthobacteraceae bacterium]|jgi:hypothetical protein